MSTKRPLKCGLLYFRDMASLTEDQAKDLLRTVLNQLWQDERRPLVGARLKAVLLKAASDRGAEFSERAIGYSGFTDFVSKSGFAAVKFRPGTDALIVPADEAEVLTRDEPDRRDRIRPDFWDAFVTFPVPREVRGYDPIADRIVKTSGSLPPSVKPITPISRETQIQWRKEFIDALGTEGNPLTAVRSQLESPGSLGLFSRTLSGYPEMRSRWSDFLARHVRDVIQAWAKENDVEEVWLVTSHRQIAEDGATRARLYALLDQIPIGKLLELRIPLGWLIDGR